MQVLRLATLAVSGALALAGCATPVIENPSWSRLPDGDDMADAYPMFASLLGVDGAARLSCVAQPDGTLADCRAVDVSPAGLGFDRAALTLTPRFVVSPRQQDGVSQKSRVTFNVRFRLPAEDEGPAPWTGPEPDPATIELLTPMATFMFEESLREQTSQPFDVDPDRVDFVRNLVTTTGEDLRDQSITSMALALARLLTPEQIEALAARRRPPGEFPTEDQVMAASDEAYQVELEFTRRVRAGYCSRYECADKIPAREAPANGTGALGSTD